MRIKYKYLQRLNGNWFNTYIGNIAFDYGPKIPFDKNNILFENKSVLIYKKISNSYYRPFYFICG